ncbi:MAG: hypothetical protein U0T36_03420 [Saprospiraceae bacterium]
MASSSPLQLTEKQYRIIRLGELCLNKIILFCIAEEVTSSNPAFMAFSLSSKERWELQVNISVTL